jgi:hypothetical protein
MAHQPCGAYDGGAGPVVRRLLFELNEQRVEAPKPIVTIVDGPGVAYNAGGVDVDGVAGGLGSQVAKDVEEHVELAGVEGNAELVGWSQPDHLHDFSSRGRAARAPLRGVDLVLL